MRGLAFLVIILCCGGKVVGQSSGQDLETELFETAKEYAYNGKKDSSLIYIDQLLQLDSTNSEVLFLKARVLSWMKEYEAARKIYGPLWKKNSGKELAISYINMEIWSDSDESAMHVLQEALAIYKEDSILNRKEIELLYKLKKLDPTLEKIDSLLDKNPDDSAMKDLRNKIRFEMSKNQVGVTLEVDHFSKVYAERYLLAIDYRRKTQIGSIIPRVNIANRFGTTGIQGEVDYYPHLPHRWAMYLNYGYSQSRLFPAHRSGIEVYRGLGNGFETSLGGRFLFFGAKTVAIYTGSVSKYLGNYLFSVRPFVTPREGRVSTSLHLKGRLYLNDELDYIEAELSGGIRFDNALLLEGAGGESLNFYRSFQFSASYVKELNYLNQLNFQAGFERFELPFEIDRFEWRIFYSLSYKRRF